MSDIVKFGKLETMRFHSFEFLKLSLHCVFYSNSENILVTIWGIVLLILSAISFLSIQLWTEYLWV